MVPLVYDEIGNFSSTISSFFFKNNFYSKNIGDFDNISSENPSINKKFGNISTGNIF
jgi:hypothetical protein